MDIIDIMLARAMTPQGKTEAYVAKAERAAQKAAAAEASAAAAINTVESAADEIAAAREEAAALLEEAQETLETAQEASINLPEAYGVTGQNTDGYMTQKAVTDALAAKADSSTLNTYVTINAMDTALAAKADASTAATKQYVDQQIASIPAGGGSGAVINMDAADANHLVKVDSNGHLVASIATEDELIEALLSAGAHIAKDAVGLDIDYEKNTFTRIQEAEGKTMGQDFNSYSMYGGRTRCNVSDNGEITAFYGDSNYTEDGTNGQVMIYQPKFYYRRVILSSKQVSAGEAIRHETLMLSPTAQVGFKLAPIFKGDLDYVLLPAFDAGLVNDKLVSIAGVEPINNLTIAEAETYARARGNGWHIMTLAAESANQMLEMVEFGHMNGQNAIGQGITSIPYGSNGNCSFITGSTASLGNGTGAAAYTNVNVNGTIQALSEDGYRAVSYRGMENPWGNLWSMIGDINVSGNGSSQGGKLYICTDFNYTPGEVGNNYEYIGFNLPVTYGWVSAVGLGDEKYDWVYIPVECSTSANSLLPIGDSLWTAGTLNGDMIISIGGSYGHKEACGPFYYAADRTVNESARNNYGAKLLYIPTKNSIYTANINKWNTYMGG